MAAVLMFAACNKDKDDLRHERDIVYTVAEQTTSVHLETEAEWQLLLDHFCDYAEGGSSVTFHNAKSANKSATKEAVTYSTTDREAMKRWMAQMEDEGKTVTVTFDPATGTWNGVAYANAPQPPMLGGIATYVSIGFDGTQGDLNNVIVTIDSANSTAYVNYNYDNQWLRMPCGRFDNIYEENGRLILYTFAHDNTVDTFYIERCGGDTLRIWFTYCYIATCDHTHGCLLVPAPQGIETYYSEQLDGIIMHVLPNAIETYPEMHLVQFCAPRETLINCIPAFHTGFCEMQRYYTSIPDINWEISLIYTYYFAESGSYYTVDSLGLYGHEIGSDTYDMVPVVIRDLHQNPGCYYDYVFNRIN